MLERNVFDRASAENAFNLYRDEDGSLDLPNAAQIRRDNLWSYLACYESLPDVFILAEAPGPWGCRFSGIPIVSELQLLNDTFPILGRRSSAADEPYDEYSARIYWRVTQPFFPRFFTWNSFPLHPHQKGAPLSIRTPGLREIATYAPVVRAMIEVLKPRRTVAVGRRAEYALAFIEHPAVYVRHPSQGGARLFEEGMLSILRRK